VSWPRARRHDAPVNLALADCIAEDVAARASEAGHSAPDPSRARSRPGGRPDHGDPGICRESAASSSAALVAAPSFGAPSPHRGFGRATRYCRRLQSEHSAPPRPRSTGNRARLDARGAVALARRQRAARVPGQRRNAAAPRGSGVVGSAEDRRPGSCAHRAHQRRAACILFACSGFANASTAFAEVVSDLSLCRAHSRRFR
jgi:hypothetical protein